MHRGTTPTLVFKISSTLPFDDIDEVWLTIEDKNNELLKTKEDLEFDATENTISVTLSQEDTLLFDVGTANVQIRILMLDGSALASNIQKVTFERILKGGVIS